jgi:hypothetical protein
MRVPIPPSPNPTPTRVAWAIALGFALFFLMCILSLTWQPLAILLALVIGFIVIWLIGGEMFNNWLDGRE